MTAGDVHLTRMQRQVLDAIDRGASISDISVELGTTRDSVKTTLSAARKKLGIKPPDRPKRSPPPDVPEHLLPDYRLLQGKGFNVLELRQMLGIPMAENIVLIGRPKNSGDKSEA